jgi:hypothetical protein
VPPGFVVFFHLLRRSLIEITVLSAGLQKLVNGQIISGGRMQTLSEGYRVSTAYLKHSKGYPLPFAHSGKVLGSRMQETLFACGYQTPFHCFPECFHYLLQNMQKKTK